MKGFLRLSICHEHAGVDDKGRLKHGSPSLSSTNSTPVLSLCHFTAISARNAAIRSQNSASRVAAAPPLSLGLLPLLVYRHDDRHRPAPQRHHVSALSSRTARMISEASFFSSRSHLRHGRSLLRLVANDVATDCSADHCGSQVKRTRKLITSQPRSSTPGQAASRTHKKHIAWEFGHFAQQRGISQHGRCPFVLLTASAGGWPRHERGHPVHTGARWFCPQPGPSIRQHEGLVQAVVRRQVLGDLTFDEALQAGRISLWHAILGYDPHRGWAFSTYAWPAIMRYVSAGRQSAAFVESQGLRQ